MAAGRDRDLLWPINTRKNDEMNLPTMKTSVLSRIRLRRGVPTALALVATLALVSSAEAQTYTWTGAGTNNNWFSTTSGSFTSANFSSSPLLSSTATTYLLFQGSTRPGTVLNRSFSASSLTFNTTNNFTISPAASQGLTVGAGGIDNQVARLQTFNAGVRLAGSGTTPVNVVAGGEIVFNEQLNFGVFEKTGSGTMTLNINSGQGSGILRSQAGTTNLTASTVNYQLAVKVNGGQVNLGPTSSITGIGVTSVTGGVFSALGDINTPVGSGTAGFQMTSGTMFVADKTKFSRGTNISGGTVSYTGTAGGGVRFGAQDNVRPLTISGGVQDFGAGRIPTPFSGDSVLVTGGTTTGLYLTQGLTNQGGSITFTAVDEENDATNYGLDLNLTSGTVSISSIGGIVTGTMYNDQNTILGAGNTLKLDFNQDGARDVLITGGTLSYGGNLALSLTNSGTIADGTTWDFFNAPLVGTTGTFAGDLAAISLSALDTYNGLSFGLATDSSNPVDRTFGPGFWLSTYTSGSQRFGFDQNTGVLTMNPVPEPSSIAAAGIGLAMLGWRRLARRRRAAA